MSTLASNKVSKISPFSNSSLSFQAERPPPPQVVQHELLMAAEEIGEYF